MNKRPEIVGFDKVIKLRKEDSDRIAAEFDIGLAGAILVGSPNDVMALHTLGHALTKLGKHHEALHVDRRLTMLAPDDETAFYNLACSYSNLGQIDDSLNALARSVALGYINSEYMLSDPDLANVRQDPRFSDIIDEARRKRGRSKAR